MSHRVILNLIKNYFPSAKDVASNLTGGGAQHLIVINVTLPTTKIGLELFVIYF